MNIRAEVVSLLSVTDLGTVLDGASRADWKRQDGTPLTLREQELVASANRQELIAGRDYAELAVSHASGEVADMTRVLELCDPYFAKLPDGANFAQVEPLMTEPERAEMREIFDRIAPDGTFFIGPR